MVHLSIWRAWNWCSALQFRGSILVQMCPRAQQGWNVSLHVNCNSTQLFKCYHWVIQSCPDSASELPNCLIIQVLQHVQVWPDVQASPIQVFLSIPSNARIWKCLLISNFTQMSKKFMGQPMLSFYASTVGSFEKIPKRFFYLEIKYEYNY